MGKTIIYQMLPRLWGNMNASNIPGGTLAQNGCGKFSGIDDATFKHLKSLGTTHVWYTGIVRHSTKENSEGCIPSNPQFVKGRAGSPYAITDWYDVNPYLADKPEQRMQEFEDLVRRTHAAGLKVIMDFVPNHVARDYGLHNVPGHPVLGAEDDRQQHWKPENDFFYYPGQALVLPVPAEGPAFHEFPAKASGNCYTPEPGINDWYETVKLNYCPWQTPTWDKMLDVIKFWAAKGVDGFRCDMVELVPIEFFRWMIPAAKAEHPDLLFVAEVYEKPKYWEYVRAGFDLLYDKSGLYDVLLGIHDGWQSTRAITSCWQSEQGLEEHLLNFVENHDEPRFQSLAALHISLLFNSTPFMMYFGEEVGEEGNDEEGFSGRNGRTTIFDWWSPAGLRALYGSIHGGQLDAARAGTLARIKALMQAASADKAFSEGPNFDLCYCNLDSPGFDPDRHFVFLRSHEGSARLVFVNFGKMPATAEIRIPEEAKKWMHLNEGIPDIVHMKAAADDGSILIL